MIEPTAESNDHGYAALIELVRAHSAKPPAPATFRELVVHIDELRPRFNEEVHDLAELYLAFFALSAIESVVERPRDEQLDLLALTVFPTAFEVEPRKGESAQAYLLRLCGDALPRECKDYVPEGWPVVLTAKARRMLKHRAQEALSTCTTCASEEVFEEVLARYSERVARDDAFAKEHEDAYLPRRWPMAAEHRAPWSGAVLLARVGGEPTLGGEPLPPGEWHRLLARQRRGAAVLGVHLEPDDHVDTLKVIARDAARAGYAELALQVRDAKYPYALGEYRLALRGRARRVDVRDIDTIQILARALDARAARSETPPRL